MDHGNGARDKFPKILFEFLDVIIFDVNNYAVIESINSYYYMNGFESVFMT